MDGGVTPLTVCLAVMLQVVLRATLESAGDDIILIYLISCIINFFCVKYKTTDV